LRSEEEVVHPVLGPGRSLVSNDPLLRLSLCDEIDQVLLPLPEHGYFALTGRVQRPV